MTKVYKQTQISVLLPEPLEERLTAAYERDRKEFKSFAEYLRYVLVSGMNCNDFHFHLGSKRKK